MKTRITELFDIQYPIIQGGMMWVGRAELASAVSNAGGLGMLTALTQPSPEALLEEIARCRSMTDNPFGVNLTILPAIKPPPYAEYAQAIIDGGVKIVETAGRSPEPFMPAFKAAGIKVIHKCTSVRHAIKAEKVGCDAVSVDGFECAGHPGEDDVTNLVLLPAAYAKLTIPMVASGGIGTGSQLAAALALGAEGVNMGSRFVATQEAPVHENMKQAMVEADERQTTLMFRSLNNTCRVFRNPISQEVLSIEAKPGETDFTDLRPLVSGERGRERCIEGGDINDGIWTVGMVMGLIHDIPTCQVLIERMMSEAQATINHRLASMMAV
ncbi:NAD(P)H-dependent flavin oxidoreductase [Microbulbifer agarilyticus]|uniref:NAD(P)H-dependent flavin oxidoreductase n=1 Tax=Microbulbifer agarilyticus TaxID=260552 RepID=UPI001CD3C6AD|nr:nitronate monooxygenase family protein [Microbulbifer agarilyticus]MCA0892435.1 nitronate monooxygenase family protein [Microbulbifer agarilyticus]